MKIYCDNCMFYDYETWCMAIKLPINHYDKLRTRYGDPKIMNKNNNCLFYKKDNLKSKLRKFLFGPPWTDA
mgnify:CR=1 FL=1